MYVRHLAHYFEVFRRPFIHILLLDDLAREPAATVASLYSFLGARVCDVPTHLYEKTNSAQMGGQGEPTDIMDRQTYEHLRGIYRPANERLAQLTDRDLLCWDQPYDDYCERVAGDSRGR
jgi:hypothetical protein